MNLLDEILGSYRNGEGLSKEATEQLAEGLLQAHRTSTNACDILRFTQRRMQAYFYQVRDMLVYQAWADMPGSEDERIAQIAQRMQWRDAAGLPLELDELDKAINFAQANNLQLPTSRDRVRQIINQVDCMLEDAIETTDEARHGITR